MSIPNKSLFLLGKIAFKVEHGLLAFYVFMYPQNRKIKTRIPSESFFFKENVIFKCHYCIIEI